jgi:hypothetical protein
MATKNGALEYWSTGVMEGRPLYFALSCPTLHYSITPLLQVEEGV